MARQARQGQPQEDLNCQVFSGHLRRLQSPGQKSRQELQAPQLGGWPMPVTLVLGNQRQEDQEFRAARWPCLCSTLEHTTFQGHLHNTLSTGLKVQACTCWSTWRGGTVTPQRLSQFTGRPRERTMFGRGVAVNPELLAFPKGPRCHSTSASHSQDQA